MRTLVISDIHGCYEQFAELLQLIQICRCDG
ncbi:MAG: metallophosphoesterase [Paenibacillaceae bacterium]